MKCQIWLTVNNDNPDFEDIAKIKSDLEEMRIEYHGKVGIGFTSIQWCNLIQNLSRFEYRMASFYPKEVMGFPVRLIHPLNEN